MSDYLFTYYDNVETQHFDIVNTKPKSLKFIKNSLIALGFKNIEVYKINKVEL